MLCCRKTLQGNNPTFHEYFHTFTFRTYHVDMIMKYDIDFIKKLPLQNFLDLTKLIQVHQHAFSNKIYILDFHSVLRLDDGDCRWVDS